MSSERLHHPSGRDYFRSYRVRRGVERNLLLDAVVRSGARLVTDSGGALAPLHVTIQDGDGALSGALVYLFSAGHRVIRHRPADEHRLQIKYGDVTEAWRRQDHRLGFDPAQLDVTAVLAVHGSAGLFVGLDPLAYDPLPMGIQVGFKAAEIAAAQRSGWHVWERPNRPGRRRDDPRAVEGFETMVAFAPERLIDYLAFERHAQTMRLDSALRLKAAERAASSRASVRMHDLELAYELSAHEILEIVSERMRLATALRGGVAEHHLGHELRRDPAIRQVDVDDSDGPPDYRITLRNGRELGVECKNASPRRYADGTPKVEVQKTRASRGDPLSRFYSPDAFDILAGCLFGPTGTWSFRFKRALALERHPDHSDRIAPIQRIDRSWSSSVREALDSSA